MKLGDNIVGTSEPPVEGGPPRILVSGFESFAGFAVNPSELLCCELPNLKAAGVFDLAFELKTVVLPVSFKRAFKLLQEAITEFNPQAVICFGLAAGRTAVEFERVGINVMDTSQPDNDGTSYQDLAIDPRGAAAYFTTIDYRRGVERLTKAGISAGISNSAGTYVCNQLFYQLLQAKNSQVLAFVHLPLLAEGHGENERAFSRDALLVAGAEVVLTAIEQLQASSAEAPGY